MEVKGNVTNMKDRISGSSTVVAVKHQVSCDLAGDAAILDMKSGIYYGLNPIGALIWQLVQAPQTVNAIRDVILREYDVEPVRCEEDLLTLLQELASRGLIEVRNEPDL
jgi:hypothetical protein